jgi:hypothetical protein
MAHVHDLDCLEVHGKRLVCKVTGKKSKQEGPRYGLWGFRVIDFPAGHRYLAPTHLGNAIGVEEVKVYANAALRRPKPATVDFVKAVRYAGNYDHSGPVYALVGGRLHLATLPDLVYQDPSSGVVPRS